MEILKKLFLDIVENKSGCFRGANSKIRLFLRNKLFRSKG